MTGDPIELPIAARIRELIEQRLELCGPAGPTARLVAIIREEHPHSSAAAIRNAWATVVGRRLAGAAEARK